MKANNTSVPDQNGVRRSYQKQNTKNQPGTNNTTKPNKSNKTKTGHAKRTNQDHTEGGATSTSKIKDHKAGRQSQQNEGAGGRRQAEAIKEGSQCSFREVVSRKLEETSTRKLLIVNFPTREHMTVVQLLVELVNKLVQVFWDMPEPQQAIVGWPVQRT